MPKDPKRKKKQRKGSGHRGSSPYASQAELNVLQSGLQGRQDVSSATLYDKALVAEQQALGEKKTSYSQRKKGDVTGLDETKNKRTKSKAQKAKEKESKKAVKAYHKKVGTTRKETRKIMKNR